VNQENVIQHPDPTNITIRGLILDNAKKHTEGDRNKTYGCPVKGMRTFAKLCQAYLEGLGWSGPPLDEVDGSMFAGFLKDSRIPGSKSHRDNYEDRAAYAAIAGECAVSSKQEGTV
jgi:hypothetical protein